MIDWNQAEKDNKNNFASMAEPGFYTVEVSGINIREHKKADSTSYWLEFEFDEQDGVRFPKLSHSISRNNINWCAYHFMNMLKEFGIPEDKAKQAIDNCESKKSEKDIIATYLSTFDRAVAKHPEVEIEVYEDINGNINPNSGRPYMRADFKNRNLAFSRKAKKANTGAPIVSQGEPIDLGDELPF